MSDTRRGKKARRALRWASRRDAANARRREELSAKPQRSSVPKRQRDMDKRLHGMARPQSHDSKPKTTNARSDMNKVMDYDESFEARAFRGMKFLEDDYLALKELTPEQIKYYCEGRWM